MSSVCYLSAVNPLISSDELVRIISAKVHCAGYGVECIKVKESEGSDRPKLVFSFTDSITSNNCEMLLLPDGCFVNGLKTNSVCFFERMKHLSALIDVVIAHCELVEMYVGDNGTYSIDEFEKVNIPVSLFASFMNQKFNNSGFSAAHIIFCGE